MSSGGAWPPSSSTQRRIASPAPLRSRVPSIVDAAHPRLRGERRRSSGAWPANACSRMPYVLASTTIERPSGVSSASEDICAASASSPSLDAGHRDERRRLAVAERDRAGLVEQQHVDVAGGLDGAARQREHVAAHEPVHAGDPDRAQQRADRRRDERDEQRDQRGDRRVGAGELGERAQRDDDDEEDDRQARQQDAERDLVRASCAARRPRRARSSGRGSSARAPA